MGQPTIVIVGAGFGGWQTAVSLARRQISCLLLDRHGEQCFIPLLFHVSVGLLAPEWIVSDLGKASQHSPYIRFQKAAVVKVSLAEGYLETTAGSVTFDYLVLATGSRSRPIPAAAFPMRTLDDAIALRNHLLTHSQQAIVVVGGGATGVELAGALAEGGLGRRIILLQSRDYLLPDLPPALARYTLRQLQRLGIEVRLGVRVQSVTGDRVVLDTGEEILTPTTIWTAGLEPELPEVTPFLELSHRQRVAVLPTLQLPAYERVYALGDLAAARDRGTYLTGVAPEALQQGVAVARNLARQLRGRTPLPFRYFNKGRLAIIGGYGGVGQIGSLPLRGWLPWVLWLAVHLIYLPGYGNRWQVLQTWFKTYGLRLTSTPITYLTQRQERL
ncbi:MAG: FAD-dependent oxidoreductase [Oscillatoriales cyanobacterium SM2_2_1]|nr:FAD-dependent oxidoreductase [Oscillatoriales cyanobacterium SM2_2_1]